MKLFIAFVFSLVLFLTVFFVSNKPTPVEVYNKINGVSLVNPFQEIDSAQMSTARRVNGEWVALIPFAFSRNGEPGVYFDQDRQWWGERVDGCGQLVRLAQANGFKVMLKPHVWMRGGWIGEFVLENEEDWRLWEQNYEAYILTYARQAEALDVEMLCIATELKQVVLQRPGFWKPLIRKIKTVYSGELTYAANWDNYQNVTFWDSLDYIGVDAYFPLVHTKNPTLAQVKRAWRPLVNELKDYSGRYGKPILFAEYGYQSADGTAGNHWEINKDTPVNLEAQRIAYEALYQSFWKEPWFAGGFLWKWHLQEGVGGVNNRDFTPQGKPVEATIAKWYAPVTSRN